MKPTGLPSTVIPSDARQEPRPLASCLRLATLIKKFLVKLPPPADDAAVLRGRGVSACRPALLPPRRERFIERAFAGGAFFDRDDGAALVGVDQGHVEPGTLLEELQVALAV